MTMTHEVAPKIVEFLNTLGDGDAAMNVRCRMAISLALKLDEAVANTSVGSAVATPAISKELRATLEEILSTHDDKDAFVANLFNG